RGARAQREGAGVAGDLRDVGGDGAVDRAVLDTRAGIRRGDEGQRRHADGDGGGRGLARVVGDGVGEGFAAGVAGRRGGRVAAVGIDRDAAVRGRRGAAGERVR